METITYYKVVTRNGRMVSETVTIDVSKLGNEIWHKSFKMASDIVNYWDTVGKGMKKYRYFLVSPDIDIKKYGRGR